MADAEFVFLCVPTPQGEDGAADLSFVDDVVREIAAHLRPGSVVINKSTVPVGSTRRVQRILGEEGASIDEIGVASNPEFLREGTSVRDFLNASRVVVGCDNPATAVRVSELYAGVAAPIVVTDPASSEMIKYASNAFLATKISFMNAIANLFGVGGSSVISRYLGARKPEQARRTSAFCSLSCYNWWPGSSSSARLRCRRSCSWRARTPMPSTRNSMRP